MPRSKDIDKYKHKNWEFNAVCNAHKLYSYHFRLISPQTISKSLKKLISTTGLQTPCSQTRVLQDAMKSGKQLPQKSKKKKIICMYTQYFFLNYYFYLFNHLPLSIPALHRIACKFYTLNWTLSTPWKHRHEWKSINSCTWCNGGCVATPLA